MNEPHENSKGKKTMCVIGGGWYGIHNSLFFSKKDYQVTIYEKNKDIAKQISGIFGIRDHVGPHYPKSKQTRETCYQDHEEFDETYPDLLIQNSHSLYVIGGDDAEGRPSKVSFPEFLKVVEELNREDNKKSKVNWSVVDPQRYGLTNVQGAVNIEEPSIVLGERLRSNLRRRLREANVNVVCDYKVKRIERVGKKFLVTDGVNTEHFDVVINATGCRSFLPPDISKELNIDLVHQVAIALVYEDQMPTTKPFSTIIMYGWYPCILPIIDEPEHILQKNEPINRHYIVTHAQLTILKTFTRSFDANFFLEKTLTEDFVVNEIKPRVESEFKKYWPEFAARFKYKGFQGCVIPKLSTTSDLRASVTVMHDGVIHMIPGKVSGVMSAAREAAVLLEGENVIIKGKYQYVRNGVYHSAVGEIADKPAPGASSTYNLQTHDDLTQLTRSRPSPTAPSPDNIRFWNRTSPVQTTPGASSSRSPEYKVGSRVIASSRKGPGVP